MAVLGPALTTVTGGSFVTHTGWSMASYLSNGNLPSLVSGYDNVIIELGTNDAVGNPSCQSLTANVNKLAAILAGKRVTFIGPPLLDRYDLKPNIQAISDCLKAAAIANGWRYIASIDFVRSGWYCDSNDSSNCGIHFIPDGYKTWAQGILQRL